MNRAILRQSPPGCQDFTQTLEHPGQSVACLARFGPVLKRTLICCLVLHSKETRGEALTNQSSTNRAGLGMETGLDGLFEKECFFIACLLKTKVFSQLLPP